jgi:hypothetical protein
MITTYLRGAALAAALLLTAIPAALADPQTDRAAREQHACAVILGLNTSNASYDTCVQSLDRSLSAAPQAKEAAACAYVGVGSADRGYGACAAALRATLWNENLRDPGD